MPAVVRRLEEHCLLEQVVAAITGDADVSHTAAPAGRFPGWLQMHGVQLTCALPGHRG